MQPDNARHAFTARHREPSFAAMYGHASRHTDATLYRAPSQATVESALFSTKCELRAERVSGGAARFLETLKQQPWL